MSGAYFHKIRPGVGIAVIITSGAHPNCVVLGKRKGFIGGGLYQLPGGHVEFSESFEQAAAREVQEETGMQLKNLKFFAIQNTVVQERNYHYVTIFMKGEVANIELGEPKNCEPEKCEGWQWVDWDAFPPADDLFWPLKELYISKKNPFSS